MKSFCLISFLHSDLVLPESQGRYSQSASLSWYAMFCFNGVPSFLEKKKKSKDPEKYFCNQSSCSLQHERTQLVLELSLAYCGLRPVACKAARVADPSKLLGKKTKTKTGSHVSPTYSSSPSPATQQNQDGAGPAEQKSRFCCLFVFVFFSVSELVGTVIFRVMG